MLTGLDGLNYLASPYSHSDPEKREFRFCEAMRATAYLMNEAKFSKSIAVFSPILHSHPLAEAHDLPTDWEYWERVDRVFMEKCDRIVVLTIEGWRESRGVQAEIKYFKTGEKPVVYMSPMPITPGEYVFTQQPLDYSEN